MERQAVRPPRAVAAAVPLLLAALLLAGGCGPRHVVPADPRSLDSANARLKDDEATLFLRDGREAPVVDVRVGRDETSWFDMGAWERRSIPNADILRIRVERPARGHVKKILYSGAGIIAIAAQTPWWGFTFGFVPLLWMTIGPPTMFRDADVYEIDVAPQEGETRTGRAYSPPP